MGLLIHSTKPNMPEQIKVGDKLPNEISLMASSNINEMGVCAKPKKVVSTIFSKGKVVLFGVPGAFTPTCHLKHLPEFVEKFADFKRKGVAMVACLSTNDVFVMDAWGKSIGVKENSVELLADGNCEFADATGLSQDLSIGGMGMKRYKRFAIIANDGIVEYVGVGDLDVCGAIAVISKL